MNAKPRMLMMLLAVVLTFGLLPLEQPTSAQSENSRCKKVKGKERNNKNYGKFWRPTGVGKTKQQMMNWDYKCPGGC